MHLRIPAVLAALLLAPAAWGAASDTWKGRAELAYTRTSGSSETEAMAGSLEGTAEAGNNRYAVKGSGLYGKTDGRASASRWTAQGRYERLLTRRLFVFASAEYLKDTFSGYDARVAVGPGVGCDVLKSPGHELKVRISGLYNYDNFSASSEDSETYASGKIAASYEWRVSEQVGFRQLLDYSVSAEDTKVYFINSETGLTVRVSNALAIGVTYGLNYQNVPPGPDAEHLDTTFTTSLVVGF